MMRYNRLPHYSFSDTMKSGVVSKRGNKYGQDYCNQYGWSRCHPMKLKSEAHESFSMLLKRDGVPPNIVLDNFKEQSLGKFVSKCREAYFNLVNIYLYSPWMMADEGCSTHLKQGLSRKNLKSTSTKRLWYHCIELEEFIILNTALDIYVLEFQVPETVMTG